MPVNTPKYDISFKFLLHAIASAVYVYVQQRAEEVWRLVQINSSNLAPLYWEIIILYLGWNIFSNLHSRPC